MSRKLLPNSNSQRCIFFYLWEFHKYSLCLWFKFSSWLKGPFFCMWSLTSPMVPWKVMASTSWVILFPLLASFCPPHWRMGFFLDLRSHSTYLCLCSHLVLLWPDKPNFSEIFETGKCEYFSFILPQYRFCYFWITYNSKWILEQLFNFYN